MDNIIIILLGIAAWIAAFLLVWAIVAGAARVSKDKPPHHPLTKNHWKLLIVLL